MAGGRSVGPFPKPIVADLGTDRATYSLVVSPSLFPYGVFVRFVAIDERARCVPRLRPVAAER